MKIGFIGAGFMGQHMIRNLIKHGNSLTVFDINKSALDIAKNDGAKIAKTPRELAQKNDVIFTSLPTPQILDEVTFGEGGIIEGIKSGTVFFDLSTTSLKTVHKIGGIANSQNFHFLDAPVSGGVKGAEDASLCIMASGEFQVFKKYESLLSFIGTQTMYCGELGSGTICKITNNLIGLSLHVLLGEAYSMGVTAGVSPETLYDAISISTGDSKQMHTFPKTLFKGDFSPGFQLDLAAKDIGLATELGKLKNIPMDLSNLVQQKYIEAQNKGFGSESATAVIKIQEEKSKINIRNKI